MRFPVLAACLTALAAFSPPPAEAAPLAAHRAVYDLEMDNASDRSGITGVRGRIVYEFEGSSCEGYTTRHRIVMRMDTEEASRFQDQQLSSYEDSEGKLYRFVTKSYLDGNEDRVVEGIARRESGGISVELKGADEKVEFPGEILFPSAHIRQLLDKIAGGETFFELPLYDGSDGGSNAYTTTVIIGKEHENERLIDSDAATATELRSWPVSIAYFDESSDTGEGLPVYRIDFVLFEDGVTKDLLIDYGDFSLKGHLVDFLRRKGEAACN